MSEDEIRQRELRVMAIKREVVKAEFLVVDIKRELNALELDQKEKRRRQREEVKNGIRAILHGGNRAQVEDGVRNAGREEAYRPYLEAQRQ